MKKIRLTKLDLTTAGLCILAIIPGVAVYNRLPEKIARHFDVNGNPDGYSGRAMVVFYPTVLYMVQVMILLYALNDSVDVTSITLTFYTILLIIIGNLLPKVKVNGSIGIRTTHTMENEEVWRKILPIILLFTAMIIVPIVYSEKVYKEEKNKETK